MVTKRTQTQKDISSLATRRGISAKRYLPEATLPVKESVPIRKAGGVDIGSPAIRQRIVEKAYELYEQRGYINGNDVQDWLDAERIVAQELARK